MDVTLAKILKNNRFYKLIFNKCQNRGKISGAGLWYNLTDVKYFDTEAVKFDNYHKRLIFTSANIEDSIIKILWLWHALVLQLTNLFYYLTAKNFQCWYDQILKLFIFRGCCKVNCKQYIDRYIWNSNKYTK